jgi:hypothetical protein
VSSLKQTGRVLQVRCPKPAQRFATGVSVLKPAKDQSIYGCRVVAREEAGPAGCTGLVTGHFEGCRRVGRVTTPSFPQHTVEASYCLGFPEN